MTAQERADKIYEAYQLIRSTYKGKVSNATVSIMAHDFTDLKTLDESWKLDVLRSYDVAIITAKKDGVTLFGTL